MKEIILTQFIHCKKACRIKEYKIEKASDSDFWEISSYPLAVGLKFDTPLTRRHSRLLLPYKTVHTEYLVTTWITLVGTVGGTLGMFVGFSIIGTSEWFMANIWKCFKNAFEKGAKGPENLQA